MSSETQVQSQTLPIGYQLEDYRVTAVLGQGGFGITYKATDETLRRDVAIKEYLPRQFAFRDATLRVHPRTQADEELFEWGLTRFVDEGRALAMFRHPNISSVIRYVQQNGTAYLVMEFEEGMDLEHWLAGRDRPDEERLVQGILVPVLEGLARVHDKGLLHRDIKPDNIFIRRDGSPVLIDFGASRPHGPEAASRLTSIISAGYSPFEQYGTGERQGPWSDLYALAGTMYRAISGVPPVDAIARHQGATLEPASKVGAGHYSKGFLEAIDKALSLDIDARPQNARELLTQLGVKPPPPPADADATVVNLDRPPAPRKPRSNRTLAVSLALVVVAAATIGSYYVLVPGQGGGAGSAETGPSAGGTTGTQQQESGPVGGAGSGAADQGASPTGAGEGAQPSESSGGQGPGNTAEGEGTSVGGKGEGDAGAPSAPDPLSEDLILSGLDLSPGALNKRNLNLTFTMKAYTDSRILFDQCQKSSCAQLPTLFAKVQKALETATWQDGGVQGSVTIENPARLENSTDCPFRLDVLEEIKVGGEDRKQTRTYCTSNGSDRHVDKAGTVS